MLELFSVLLRTWQLSLFELWELRHSLFLVALVIIIIAALVCRPQHIVGVHFYSYASQPFFCLHRAFNLLERVFQFKVLCAIPQIKYPCEPTVADELIICHGGKKEKNRKRYVNGQKVVRCEAKKLNSSGLTPGRLFRAASSNPPLNLPTPIANATGSWSLKISNFFFLPSPLPRVFDVCHHDEFIFSCVAENFSIQRLSPPFQGEMLVDRIKQEGRTEDFFFFSIHSADSYR